MWMIERRCFVRKRHKITITKENGNINGGGTASNRAANKLAARSRLRNLAVHFLSGAKQRRQSVLISFIHTLIHTYDYAYVLTRITI